MPGLNKLNSRPRDFNADWNFTNCLTKVGSSWWWMCISKGCGRSWNCFHFEFNQYLKVTRNHAVNNILRHYNLQLVYSLTHFWSPFLCFQGSFFQKILSLCIVTYYTRAVYNQEGVMMLRVRYLKIDFLKLCCKPNFFDFPLVLKK